VSGRRGLPKRWRWIDAQHDYLWGWEGVTYIKQDLRTGEWKYHFEYEPRIRIRDDIFMQDRECKAWGRMSDDWIRKARPDDVRKLAEVYRICWDLWGLDRIMTLRPDVKL
jgi:hypothetical protein